LPSPLTVKALFIASVIFAGSKSCNLPSLFITFVGKIVFAAVLVFIQPSPFTLIILIE